MFQVYGRFDHAEISCWQCQSVGEVEEIRLMRVETPQRLVRFVRIERGLGEVDDGSGMGMAREWIWVVARRVRSGEEDLE